MRPTNVLATVTVLFVVSSAAPRNARASTSAPPSGGSAALTLRVSAAHPAAASRFVFSAHAREAEGSRDAVVLPRRETTAELRVYEADQVYREVPESAIGKPIVTLGIAEGSRLQMRFGPACKSLSSGGIAFAGRF